MLAKTYLSIFAKVYAGPTRHGNSFIYKYNSWTIVFPSKSKTAHSSIPVQNTPRHIHNPYLAHQFCPSFPLQTKVWQWGRTGVKWTSCLQADDWVVCMLGGVPYKKWVRSRRGGAGGGGWGRGLQRIPLTNFGLLKRVKGREDHVTLDSIIGSFL